ncbi:MAG: ABC transporter substrate-binding protein [Reyranella sp.]|uniref:ABC transporter substrate-binding protein n=1 Tax=Reyranella sp. TaxID=1929291 RepID=UPI00272F707D|nr:ABC transporter substrate-binding protein [Reyranella sp.]MDP1963081.1 ABC transporter substrate-binding protein [Reyranella sp.]MDP2378761.1 ABC transporter substrate-binding protein [Reyranella sp.]
MTKTVRRRSAIVAMGSVALSAVLARSVQAKSYGPGVTDQEIKLGTTSPYSGPASGFGVYGNAQTAYFKMINDQGGINGRKINLISLDNGYNPPKALEMTRQLVESDNVLAIAGFLGTAPNTAVQKYLNTKKVPSLFLTSGAERFNDPKEYPWIIPLYPTFVAQGISFGRYILAKNPGAKIAVLYINDDLGKDFLRGLQIGLGDKAKTMIVRAVSHELTDPTVETQIIDLKATGADTLLQFTTPKFAAQGIRKVADLSWKPMHFLASIAAGIGATLIPAGIERSIGILTARWEKTPTDTETANDPDIKQFAEFAAKYMPSLNLDDNTAVPGYINAFMIARVLKMCGDELTRENILKQATSLKDVRAPLLLPGILLTNSPTDYGAFHSMQLAQFDGKRWVPVGGMINTDALK